MSNIRTILAAFALGSAVAFVGPAFADTLKATLNGASEAPANTSTGKGTAEVEYDPTSKMLRWKLTFSGLTGIPTAAHFHGPAEAGKTAPKVVTIMPNQGYSPVEGSATLTDAQAADLMAGKYYINIHTVTYPGGEIRGQVTKLNFDP
jgi:hypothetical protein